MILSGIEENTQNELFKPNLFKHDVIVIAPSTTVVQCTVDLFTRIISCHNNIFGAQYTQSLQKIILIIRQKWIRTMMDDNNYTGDGTDYLTYLENQLHELRNKVRWLKSGNRE